MAGTARARIGVHAFLAAATLITIAVFISGFFVVVDVVEGMRLTQLRATSRMAGEQIRGRVEEVTEGLRQLALDRSALDAQGLASWPGQLERMRLRNPRLLQAIVVVDETGGAQWMVPAKSWPAGTAFSSGGAVEGALETQRLSFGRVVESPDGSAVVFAAVTVPLGVRSIEHTKVLAAALDLREISRQILDPLAVGANGLACIGTRDGVLVAVAGEGAPRAPAGLERLLPGNEQAALRQGLRSGGRVEERAIADLAGHREAVTLRSEPIGLSDVAWVLAVLAPRRAMLAGARPLLLLGGLLLLLVVGGSVGAGTALHRLANRIAGLRRETERWRRAAEAFEREGRGRLGSEEAREPVLYLRDRRVVSANPAALRALELGEMAELLGRSFDDFAAPDERARIARFLVGRVAGANVPEQFQTRLVTAKGGSRLVEMMTSLVEREGSVFEQVTWRDVTSRERAETLLRAVSGSIPAALALCEPDGRLSWANHAFAAVSQYEVERLHGHPLLPLVAQKDRRRAIVMLARARRGSQVEAPLRLARRDGTTVLLAVQAAPVTVAGELFGVLFTASEMRGEGTRREQVDWGEVLATLATSVSHRLNNDLQALLGVLESLKADHRILPVRDGIERLIATVAADLHRFVVVSRGAPGTMQPLRLGALLDRWLVSATPHLPVGVRLSVRRATAEDRIVGDEAQLGLVLDLALAASVSSLQVGGGAVEVSLEDAPGGSGVRLSIADTGEPGEREGGDSPSGEPLLPARDLAIAVTGLVAARHEGESGSRERSGIGNLLWLDLPIRWGAMAKPAPVRRAARVGAVLVADDEEMVRASLAGVLRERGYDVVEAGNGAEVVEKVLANPSQFALVVLDLVMPVMDGREVLRRFAQDCPELPVLVCTGYDPSGDETFAAAEILVKPFSLEEFVARIQGLFAAGDGQASGSGTINQ